MKTAQIEFETVFHAQAEANAVLREKDSASSIRKSIETALRNYLNLINAMRAVEIWKALYNELNEIIKAATGSSVSSKEIESGTTA